MDIFKFNSPTADTLLEQGEIINNLKSKMWVERYRRHGEFTLVASASSGLRKTLPIGSIISHVDTDEIMIVENHEINDDGPEPELEISGRGFETFFENRVIGSNKAFPTNNGVSEYILASDQLANQAITLMNDHILAENLIDTNNAVPYVTVMTDVAGDVVPERAMKRENLYSSFVELLDVDDLGVKVVRPGPRSPLGVGSPNIVILIHKGVDRSSQIVLSYDTGEIESAAYLWSNKKYKNCAVVSGKWIEVFVDTPEAHYDRRMMHVDASDIDEHFDAAPVEPELTQYTNLIRQRGEEVLAAQKNIAITKAEVSRDRVKPIYRKDYDVGDFIMVNGDYNETSKMRIEEFVEIEDDRGSQGYPTLTKVE